MKLTIVFLSLFCLISIKNFCQVRSYNLFAYGNDVENPVSAIQSSHIFREIDYRYNLKKHNNADSTGVSVSFYDTTGHLIEFQKYDNGILQLQDIYKYYTDNTIYTMVENDISAKTTYTTRYQYDSLGREVYKYYYNRDTTTLTIWQKEYNSKGQVMRLYTKTGIDKFYLNKQYQYNEDGEVLKTITLDEKGKIMYSAVIEYEPGKETFYLENENGKVKRKETYFNDKSQLIKVIIPASWYNNAGPNGSVSLLSEYNN